MVKQCDFITLLKKTFKTDDVKAKKILPKMIELRIVSDDYLGMDLDKRWRRTIQIIKLHFPELYKNYYFRMEGLLTREENNDRI